MEVKGYNLPFWKRKKRLITTDINVKPTGRLKKRAMYQILNFDTSPRMIYFITLQHLLT